MTIEEIEAKLEASIQKAMAMGYRVEPTTFLINPSTLRVDPLATVLMEGHSDDKIQYEGQDLIRDILGVTQTWIQEFNQGYGELAYPIFTDAHRLGYRIRLSHPYRPSRYGA